jgi:hypothetical protein
MMQLPLASVPLAMLPLALVPLGNTNFAVATFGTAELFSANCGGDNNKATSASPVECWPTAATGVARSLIVAQKSSFSFCCGSMRAGGQMQEAEGRALTG